MRILFFILMFIFTGCSTLIPKPDPGPVDPPLVPGEEPKVGNTCREMTVEEISFKYCIYNDGSASKDLLYYWHGTMDSEKAWTKASLLGAEGYKNIKKVQAVWKAKGVHPRVIVLSFGGSWYMTKHKNNKHGGSHAWFSDKVIPELEKIAYPNGLKGNRYIMGVSMGGRNALNAYLHKPSLYKKAVFLYPSLPYCKPYISVFTGILCYKELIAEGDAGNLGKIGAIAATEQVKAFYPTKELYEADDPFMKAEAANSSYPPVHMQVGSKDDFGFQKKTPLMAAKLKSKGVSVQYQLNPGLKHQQFDTQKVADFLIP